MNTKNAKLLSLMALAAMAVATFSSDANATAQFARRYNVSCNLCHTAFPRLNSFGEKFAMNGYQMPGTSGEDTQTKISDNLSLGDIGKMASLRISIIPFSTKKGGLTVAGHSKDQTAIGRGQWFQFFTAGSIAKNISIFIETEFENDKLHNNWLYMGFHNLAGPEGALNFRVGNLCAFDWHSVSGRLRANPPLKYSIMGSFKSAKGGSGNEDQLGIASANPGAEVFGYSGNFLYSGVVQSGKQVTASGPDTNQFQNYTGTLGYMVNDGDFEGSKLTLSVMSAVDTSSSSYKQRKDNLYVFYPGVTIRYKGLDLQGAFLYAKEDNYKLAAAKNKAITRGVGAGAGYYIKDNVYGHLQYDWLASKDARNLGKYITEHYVSPSVWFFPRANIRMGLTGKYDMDAKNANHKFKKHEVFSTIRAMF
ncbi:MAG: hypothetical protein AUJ51_02375 [Elusimicrobia bacterium CG1_02_56_21]|nr:MAG: hypothetical protein AUJ51_02375 [Elusimicrobia bacterium CG1_02_56_21]